MAKAQHRMEIKTYKRDTVKLKWNGERYEIRFGAPGGAAKFAILITDDQLGEIMNQFGREQSWARIEANMEKSKCSSRS
jgi:hypothetical protein